MPTEITIDPERLRELASDPNNKTKAIVGALGMSSGTFSTKLTNNPELKRIYEEGRAAAREARGLSPISAKAPRKGSKKGKKKSATPPRKGNARTDHKELFGKLSLEFDHINLYGEVSEHFDELRIAVAERGLKGRAS